MGGSEFTFASLLGQGAPVVLNVCAPQCPPCLVETPASARGCLCRHVRLCAVYAGDRFYRVPRLSGGQSLTR